MHILLIGYDIFLYIKVRRICIKIKTCYLCLTMKGHSKEKFNSYSSLLGLSKVIYQTRERVFHQDIQTPRSGLKKQGAAKFLLTDFSVFGYMTKHSFEFLVWLLKPFIILEKIQSKESFAKFYANYSETH